MAVIAFISLSQARAAYGGDMTVHVGPPSLGSGGSNPVSFPPVNPLEYEIIYITDARTEFCLAAVPGLLFGKRSDSSSSGAYISFGGGLVIDSNGAGPGVYSSFGWESKGSIRFNAEYKQAVGFDFGGDTIISPFAIRVGAAFDL
jgi:hypothetical protein